MDKDIESNSDIVSVFDDTENKPDIDLSFDKDTDPDETNDPDNATVSDGAENPRPAAGKRLVFIGGQ